jgi:MFS superfamily sulfate permease-like transporter
VDLNRFAPGLTALANYRRKWLAGDLAAGCAIAAVSLPLPRFETAELAVAAIEAGLPHHAAGRATP